MRSSRNIIWDFDGTLFDTYTAIIEAFASVLKSHHNLSVDSDRLYELMKVDTKHCAQVLATENVLDPQKLLNSAREAYNSIGTSGQRPFEHVRELCNKVMQAGGSNFLVTHRDRKSLDVMLTEHDFHSVFVEIITSNDGYPQKPSPESFNYLINKYELSVNNTIGIGDRELDVLAANAAGISSVFFCSCGGKNSNADISISSFSELYSSIV